MKRFILIILFFVTVFTVMNAQKLSFSAQYLYLDQEGNHGAGVQSKIRLKNQFYLQPDAGFYFDKYRKTGNTSSFTESYTLFCCTNVNFAYRLPLTKNLSLYPFAGVGLFDKYTRKHLYSSGAGYTPNYGGYTSGYSPFDMIIRDHYISISLNGGFSIEYTIVDHVFITTGVSYLYDTYQPNAPYRKDYFPLINMGIGYNF